ncbi:MAG: hypothetical protein EXR62_09305 [Chloroflexi bacterium]|nr:hypothetical protein [Chloroflexota bacterium]
MKLEEGMLWQDSDKKHPLAAKIKEAAAWFAEKYGAAPDVCYVHPEMLPADKDMPDGPHIIDGVEVLASRFINRGLLWIGVASQSQEKLKAS